MTNIQEEIWKDVIGFDCYQVSSNGRVKRIKAGAGTHIGKIITPSLDTWGYLKLLLAKNGKYYPKRIHRLVAIAFHPNPDNKPTVNHVNRDKTDNRSVNLEWATHSENMRHAFKTRSDNPKISITTNGYLRRVKK